MPDLFDQPTEIVQETPAPRRIKGNTLERYSVVFNDLRLLLADLQPHRIGTTEFCETRNISFRLFERMVRDGFLTENRLHHRHREFTATPKLYELNAVKHYLGLPVDPVYSPGYTPPAVNDQDLKPTVNSSPFYHGPSQQHVLSPYADKSERKPVDHSDSYDTWKYNPDEDRQKIPAPITIWNDNRSRKYLNFQLKLDRLRLLKIALLNGVPLQLKIVDAERTIDGFGLVARSHRTQGSPPKVALFESARILGELIDELIRIYETKKHAIIAEPNVSNASQPQRPDDSRRVSGVESAEVQKTGQGKTPVEKLTFLGYLKLFFGRKGRTAR